MMIPPTDDALIVELEKRWKAAKARVAELEAEVSRLAVPELVRILLAVEWTNNDDEDLCPSCGGLKPGTETRWTDPDHIGHRADCGLDIALRKAGVR